MVKCRECGAEISSKASACPHCGRPQAKKTSLTTWVLGGLITFVVGSCVVGTANRTPYSVPAATTTTAAAIPAKVPPTAGAWSYHTLDDPLRKTSGKTAEVDSEETFKFGFPYNETPNAATLGLQDKPGTGKGVWISIAHGQFSCVTDCTVALRFDDGPVRKVTARGAAAGQSNAIFLPYQSTIGAIKKSKRLYVEATFYKEGDKQMTFDLRGLDWRE